MNIYHQKLAEAMAKRMRYLMLDAGPPISERMTDEFLAVLADEGVMDPEEHAKLMEDYASGYRAWHETERQLADLRAKVAEAEKHLSVNPYSADAAIAALAALRAGGSDE